MEDARRTDEELLLRFRDGDVHAFEALVDRYSSSVYNFALRYLADGADAADVAQLTFVQAFESFPGLHADSPLRPWLMTVARNKCIDVIRRRRTIPLSALEGADDPTDRLDVADEAPLPEELYERGELQALVQEAIDTLPPRSREVVLLRYVSGLTFAEVARVIGVPENTAKTLFQRSKTQLRAFLRRRL